MKEAFEQFILKQIAQYGQVRVTEKVLETVDGEDFLKANTLNKTKDETCFPDEIKLVLDKS